MSEQEFYTEWTGRILVYHPVKKHAEVTENLSHWAEWHKARLARCKPISYEESQAMLAVFQSGAHLKAA